MPPIERLSNSLIGLSVLSWAVLGLLDAPAGDRLAAVRLAIVGLNLTVGVLLISRRPLVRDGGLWSLLVSLPAFVAGPLALRSAPPLAEWPAAATLLFCGGAAMAIVSFLYLGRSFAIFPAFRGTVVGGPYRVVRHPAYVGETVMVVGCVAAAHVALPAVACLAAALPSIALRILVEERVLREASQPYRDYVDTVRWRMVPGVW